MEIKSKNILKYICLFLIVLSSFVKSEDDFKETLKKFPQERIISLDDPLTEFNVNKNLDFIIKVKGNPTTGYGWFLKKNSYDGKLTCTNLDKYNSSKDFIVNDHPPGWTGVGGVYYFMFKGLETGLYELEFINKRPWEETNYRERRINIQIN